MKKHAQENAADVEESTSVGSDRTLEKGHDNDQAVVPVATLKRKAVDNTDDASDSQVDKKTKTAALA